MLLDEGAGGIHDVVDGIVGIAEALYADTDEDTRGNLHAALRRLAGELHHATYEVPHDVAKKVERVLEAPDSRAEQMEKVLSSVGCCLWESPTARSRFAVTDTHGRAYLAHVSIDEIDAWLERRNLEQKVLQARSQH